MHKKTGFHSVLAAYLGFISAPLFAAVISMPEQATDSVATESERQEIPIPDKQLTEYSQSQPEQIPSFSNEHTEDDHQDLPKKNGVLTKHERK
jgi:hypothetical protein